MNCQHKLNDIISIGWISHLFHPERKQVNLKGSRDDDVWCDDDDADDPDNDDDGDYDDDDNDDDDDYNYEEDDGDNEDDDDHDDSDDVAVSVLNNDRYNNPRLRSGPIGLIGVIHINFSLPPSANNGSLSHLPE